MGSRAAAARAHRGTSLAGAYLTVAAAQLGSQVLVLSCCHVFPMWQLRNLPRAQNCSSLPFFPWSGVPYSMSPFLQKLQNKPVLLTSLSMWSLPGVSGPSFAQFSTNLAQFLHDQPDCLPPLLLSGHVTVPRSVTKQDLNQFLHRKWAVRGLTSESIPCLLVIGTCPCRNMAWSSGDGLFQTELLTARSKTQIP